MHKKKKVKKKLRNTRVPEKLVKPKLFTDWLGVRLLFPVAVIWTGLRQQNNTNSF